MAENPWPRYPPCASGLCSGPVCCAQGRKWRWEEVVGMPGKTAKEIIERENEEVSVIMLPPGRVGLSDFCCNRVYLVLDGHGNVLMPPQVG